MSALLKAISSNNRWRVLWGKSPVVFIDKDGPYTGHSASWEKSFKDFVKAHSFLERVVKANAKLPKRAQKPVYLEQQSLIRVS